MAASPYHSPQGPSWINENGGHSAPAPAVTDEGNPPRIRKTHKPGTLSFINKLTRDAKLEINTEIESRNRERAEKRFQWFHNPQGDYPDSDDESTITTSEDDIDRLSDPIFFKLAPAVTDERNPPRIRKTYKPEFLSFINELTLDAKLEINTEIESRNRERAKKRFQWFRNPQGEDPVSDDESIITISEDDIDRLPDPVFLFNTLSIRVPFSIQNEISRKRRRKSDTGVRPSHCSDGPIDKHRRIEGPSPESQVPMNANGFLQGASHFVLNQPVMIDGAKERVFQWLAKFTMPRAEFDASDHVPGCHPGTRLAILETMKQQSCDALHTYRMLWLRGPAGVGKSAILQSLAEQLSETSSLGATLFFSRPNQRHQPGLVIPTIAYQLAVRIPLYREHVKQIMANEPKLLEKDVERQFQALIIEPFTKLGLTAKENRWVVLLDGLDECQGEDAQILFVNLISRFTRHHPTVPLVWVIASRPEAHLQAAFNSEGVRGSFEEHEILANSDDGCHDVEKFLRSEFKKIRQKYEYLMRTGVLWPAERDFTRVSTTSSGLFALATTIVHYVDDPDACDPVSRLATILSTTEGLEPGTLSTLYSLYSAILAGVPKNLSPTLKLILAFHASALDEYSIFFEENPYPLVLYATIFRIDQHMVYGALQKLHSVIKVPPPSESDHLVLEFYHASFPDYLKTLEDYTISVDIARKYWWGLFELLRGGDSTAYQAAVSDGRPPVRLSWDVEVSEAKFQFFWFRGITELLHLLLPRCWSPDETCMGGHPCLFSGAKEQQDALEKIDFSALVLANVGTEKILEAIYFLFKWLVDAVPATLPQSGVARKIPMKNLDLARVSKTKFSLKGCSDFCDGDDLILFEKSITAYGGQPLKYANPAYPIEDLFLELGKLQSEYPMMNVLVVGGQPSKRCALVSIRQTGIDEKLELYYIPYCG